MKKIFWIAVLILVAIFAFSGHVPQMDITGHTPARLPPPTTDLGDAPDSTNSFSPTPPPGMTAYPPGGPPGVYADYPTVLVSGSPPYGPCHYNFFAVLGQEISDEQEADIGPDVDGLNNIDSIVDIPDQDSISLPFGMDDGLKHVPINLGTNALQLNHCQPTTIPVEITTIGIAMDAWTAYVNIWIDYNRDGDWGWLASGDTVTCYSPSDTPEWVVVNHPIAVPAAGFGTQIFNITFTGYVPTSGDDSWMRVQLTEVPVSSSYADGSGPGICYEDGETEDYYVELFDPCSCNSCADCEAKINSGNCSTVTLANDINISGNCIEFTTDNVVLDCLEHSIQCSDSGSGVIIASGYTGNTVQNCNIHNCNNGIYIGNSANNNNILGNTISNSDWQGIYLSYASYAVIDDNEVYSNDNGILVETCFLAGTKILMADNSYKNIEDVNKGDLVKSFEGDAEVINTYFHDETDSYLVINDLLKLTANHPMYVNSEWKEAGEIKLGDLLLDKDGNSVPIISIETIEETVPVYNLEVAGTHNYYAENLLTHNKCPRVFTDNGEEYEFDCLINMGHDGIETDEVYSYNLKHIKAPRLKIEDDPYEDNFIDFIKLKVGDKIIDPVSCNCDLSLIAEQDRKYLELDEDLYIEFEELPEGEVEVLSGGYQIILEHGPYPEYVTAFIDEFHEIRGKNSYSNITNNIVINNTYAGINLWYEDYSRVINNTVAYNREGITLGYSENNLLEDNEVFNNSREGILIEYDSDLNTISGGEIYFNNLDESWNYAGIVIDGDFDIPDSTLITGVYMHDNKLFAIKVRYTEYTTIVHNHIDDNCGGNSQIIMEYADYSNISYNNVTHGTGDGIQIYNSEFIEIHNNNISNNNNNGLWFADLVHNSTVRDNVIGGNGGEDITLHYSYDNTFRDNTLSSYPTKISFAYENAPGTWHVRGVNFVPVPDPTGYHNISKFVDIRKSVAGPSWVFLNISYSDSDISYDESSLKIWKYNYTDWVEDGWNSARLLDTTNNIVGVNITDFGSIYAPLEEEAAAAVCGNNIIETGEECDGTNLGGESCISLGFDGGTLHCSNCLFDTSDCTTDRAGGGGGRTDGGITSQQFTGLIQSFNLGTGSSVCFYYQNLEHCLRILGINPNYVDLILTSDPQEFTLAPGKTEKLDVDGDGTKDLEVTLLGISPNQQTANVQMKWISEELPTTQPIEEVPEVVEEGVVVKKVKMDVSILGILAIVAIVLVFYAVSRKKKTRRY